MKAIIVDDELLMIKKFLRLSEGIEDLNIVGSFEYGDEAIKFAQTHQVDIAFLDVSMPIINGIEVAKKLREIRKDILIVFISAYEEYLKEFNAIGGDYYIIKPYDKNVLQMAMERIRLVAHRQQKSLYVQTFGRFLLLKDGFPIPLTGKAKEILALIVIRRGKEISNEEIFSTVWEEREYSNSSMTVYYNALRRLKNTLSNAGIADILISTPRGQMVNTSLFDCDYYAYQDKNMLSRDRFEGEFLSEYSWGEYYLAGIMNEHYGI